MMSASIFESVRDSLAEQLSIDPGTITLESKIADDLGADSLDSVEMIMALEEQYDIVIEAEDAEGLLTVADVVALLEAASAK